ncbi:TrpR-related protein YerC/YecD [Elusimicrobium posterum]|uniref:YerC/YecD family TrpR-related protein n=1 Tax=Elusimicrobium posterum TaxID=3116653 RepID=UPI003C711D27
MTKEIKHHSLYEALLEIKTIAEAERFLKDLCTPSELRDLNERWQVAQMLSDGNSYRQINENTGISTTTIGRVSRFLNDEDYKGYKLILERVRFNENK